MATAGGARTVTEQLSTVGERLWRISIVHVLLAALLITAIVLLAINVARQSSRDSRIDQIEQQLALCCPAPMR